MAWCSYGNSHTSSVNKHCFWSHSYGNPIRAARVNVNNRTGWIPCSCIITETLSQPLNPGGVGGFLLLLERLSFLADEKNISRDDVYRFKTDKHWLYHPETTESCNNSLEGDTNANYCELKIGVSYTTLGPKFYICVVFSERVVYILDRFWTAFRSAATTGPNSIGIRTTCLKKRKSAKNQPFTKQFHYFGEKTTQV